MAASVKGYKCIVVMPMKMSREKVDALRLLGAKIVRTPTAAAFNELDGLIRVAHKLHLEDPENTIILDQVRQFDKFCLLSTNDYFLFFIFSIVTNIILWHILMGLVKKYWNKQTIKLMH